MLSNNESLEKIKHIKWIESEGYALMKWLS